MKYFKFHMIPISLNNAFWILLLVITLISCGGSNTSGNKENFQKLEDLVSKREFKIENNWAFPNNGGNINLIGNPNHLIFNKDSVDVYLPYFGVRNSGGGYGNDQGGIIYVGLAEDLQIKENPEKGNIQITFDGMEKGENLQFRLTLYPNKNARTYVITSQRTTISYEGKLNELEENMD